MMAGDAESRIADWCLRRGSGTGSARVLAEMYLALHCWVPCRIADIGGTLDEERRGWVMDLLAAYAKGRFTGQYADAIAERYDDLLTRMRAADDAMRQGVGR